MAPGPDIETVLRELTERLMPLPGVQGIALGLSDGQPCIRVLVRETSVVARLALPASQDGWPLRVEVAGMFHSRNEASAEGRPT